MCYKPNVIISGEFAGSLKYLIDNKKYDEMWARSQIMDGKWKLVPCGQCLQCRIKSSEAWATRIELETKYVKNAHFVTLTYDDEHLPVHNIIEDSYYHGIVNPRAYVEGVTIERPTLIKKDLQDFLKRVRINAKRKGLIEDQADGLGIRFFACGEYGDISHRPHYHIIIFGLQLQDLEVNYRKNGYEHDRSAWLEKQWGQGIVDIGSCTYNSARYVAQYVVKKQKGEAAKKYAEAGIAPEFIQMSLKPGIGQRDWNDNRGKYYPQDIIYLQSGHKSKPPRYFDKLEDAARIAEEYGTEMAAIKEEVDAEEYMAKMESDYMKDIRAKRRKKANDALFNRLRATSGTTILEYYDNIGKKYENAHCLAKDRGYIDRPTG